MRQKHHKGGFIMRGIASFFSVLIAFALVSSGAVAQQSAPPRGKSEIVVVYWSADD
jgi:hypothetical protein